MKTMVDKQKLVLVLKSQLEQEIILLKEAARATYEAATHEESKPENEYDTFGLEASYLAGAQAQRVSEMEELVSICKFVETKNFTDEDTIDSTALVQVKSGNKTSWLFFLPKGGGINVNFEGKSVQVITPASPLGEALIGLQSGDIATVEAGARSKEYEIISVH
jgi:transcription elongation GreA/GreB family factor